MSSTPVPAPATGKTVDTISSALTSVAERDSQQTGGRRGFLTIFLGSLLAFTLLYLAAVSVIDPRRRFFGRAFPEILMNSRAEKLRMFESYASKNNVAGIILGSSRSMALNPARLSSLTGKRFFNFGVYSGAPEDFVAIYRTLRLRGHRVDEIVVALDLVALRPAELDDELKANPTLLAGLSGATPSFIDFGRHWITQYKETLSIPYAKDVSKSVQVFLERRKVNQVFSPDGGIAYARWEEEMRAGTFDPGPAYKRCEDGQTRTFRNFSELSAKRVSWLRDFVQDARAGGTSVRVSVTPYHPRTLDVIARDPRASINFRKAAGAAETLLKDLRVPFANFTNVAAFDGQPDNWHDCTHFDSRDADRIVDRLFQRVF
jgi:hypothetical protein